MLSSYSKKIIGIHANSAGEFEKVLTHLFNKKLVIALKNGN